MPFSLPRERSNHSNYPDMKPVSHKNDRPGKTSSVAPCCHLHLGEMKSCSVGPKAYSKTGAPYQVLSHRQALGAGKGKTREGTPVLPVSYGSFIPDVRNPVLTPTIHAMLPIPTPYQRSFFLQHVETLTKIHKCQNANNNW